jgi:lipopolysaccharide transport system ATP-binding protein
MADLAISAHGLGKRYRLGRVESGFRRLRRAIAHQPSAGHIWAVEDVTFDVPTGSALAIVGRNGAGKSTLLKLLARITEPTHGYADVAGRVGALLEVGTGFHPELTGRENVYLNGTILGMTREDVRRRFDDIVEFAGVERHIDTPVKWYSSGMYVRLGFAVAAHMEPDILIVDEVLSVGDAEFQKRCLGRIDGATHEGRTVLFVSHNMQAVRRVCKEAIMLERGRMIAEGSLESVVREYLASVESPELGRRRWELASERPGDELCRVVEVRVTDEADEPSTSFFSSNAVMVTIEFDLSHRDTAFVIGFDLATVDGVTVLRSTQADVQDGKMPELKPGRNAVRCLIPAGLLNTGRYVVNLRSWLHGAKWIAHENAVLYFDVVADHGDSLFYHDQTRPGVVAPVLSWQTVPSVTEYELSETPAAMFASG